MTRSAALPRERICLLAAQIHELGPRTLRELLVQIDRGAALHPALERYAALKLLASFIRDMGGRDLKPARLASRRR